MMIALLPACRDQAPPAPTAEESAQLNEAEDLLNGLAENQSDQPNASNTARDASPTTTNSGTANRNQAP